MESGIQSSFIPKDAGKVAVPPRQGQRGGLGDLMFLVAIVMFVVSLALAGAVFLYNQYLNTSVTSKIEQLKKAREAFEPALIQQLTRLDDRMRAADSVLSVHLAPTAFFLALSQVTLSTVSFRSVDLDASDPKKITVKMPGVAQSVNSIALQADLMSKNGVVTNPIFSNISRQADGVHFDMTAHINPAAVNFVSLIGAATRAAAPQESTMSAQGPASFEQQSAATPEGTATQQSQTQPEGDMPQEGQSPFTN